MLARHTGDPAKIRVAQQQCLRMSRDHLASKHPEALNDAQGVGLQDTTAGTVAAAESPEALDDLQGGELGGTTTGTGTGTGTVGVSAGRRRPTTMKATVAAAEQTEAADIPSHDTDVAMNLAGAHHLMSLVMQAAVEKNAPPGVALADQMGTGKTHTILLLLFSLLRQKLISLDNPAIIVVPDRLVDQWMMEIRKWKHIHNWEMLQQTVQRIDGTRVPPASSNSPLRAAVHLCASRDFTDQRTFCDLLTYSYRIAVSDESRGFEDPLSTTSSFIQLLRSQIGSRLRRQGEDLFVIAITGTPMGSSLVNAANFLSLLRGTPVSRRVDDVAASCRDMIVRRLLPVNYQVKYKYARVPLSPGQRKAYVDTLVAAGKEGATRSGVSKAEALRRVCQFAPPASSSRNLDWAGSSLWGFSYEQLLVGSSKLAYFDNWLQDALQRGARILVFAFSKASRLLLQAYIDQVVNGAQGVPFLLVEKLGNAVPFIFGGEPSQNTCKAVQRFESGGPLMFLSAIAGGRGLNCPSATDIFKFDALQSERMEQQVEARAIRRTRAVDSVLRVWQTVAADTIEEGMYVAVWAKAALASAMTEGRCATHFELKCRLLEGAPKLHLNSYAFGVRWRPAGDVMGGRNLTKQLPSVVHACEEGNFCFNPIQIQELVSNVELRPDDFIILGRPYAEKVVQLSCGSNHGLTLVGRMATDKSGNIPAARVKSVAVGGFARGKLFVNDLIVGVGPENSPVASCEQVLEKLGATSQGASSSLTTESSLATESSGHVVLHIRRSECSARTRRYSPSDWYHHDLAGSFTTLVADYAHKILSSASDTMVQSEDWYPRCAQDDAFGKLRESLTTEAAALRWEARTMIRQRSKQEEKKEVCKVMASARTLRSGLDLDVSDALSSSQRAKRLQQRLQHRQQQIVEEAHEMPSLPVVPLPCPETMTRIKNMFVECPYQVGSGNAWQIFAGIVNDANVACQTFTVHFKHESFLRLDDACATFNWTDINSRAVYLISEARAHSQWMARARDLDSQQQRTGIHDPCIRDPDWISYQHITERWLWQQQGIKRKARPPETFTIGDRVSVEFDGVDYPGTVVGCNTCYEVLFDDGERHNDVDAKELSHIEDECPEAPEDDGAEQIDMIADPTIDFEQAELDLVDEEDVQEDVELRCEANQENLKALERHLAKLQRKAQKTGMKINYSSLSYLPHDGELTSEDAELSGLTSKLSHTARGQHGGIEIGYKALVKAVRGKGGSTSDDKSLSRRFHIPRSLSLLHLPAIRDGMRAQLPRIQCICSEGGPGDGNSTLLLHLPAAEVSNLYASGGSMHPSDVSQLLHGAAAVWLDAAPMLRGLLFDLVDAEGFVPSRKTHQFFGGYDANAHKGDALLRQAMAVHRDDSHVAGIRHHDLRVPTLVSRTYVEGGSVRLGQWLSPLTLARAKHENRVVQKGMCAGLSYETVFMVGLRPLFAHMSSHLTMALVAANPDAGVKHLETIPHGVRLGRRSVHTTWAFYYSGVLLKEAKDNFRVCQERYARAEAGETLANASTLTSNGVRLRNSIQQRAEARLKASLSLLPAEAHALVSEQYGSSIGTGTGTSIDTGTCIDRHPAEFMFPSQSAARAKYNRLAADGRVARSKETITEDRLIDVDEGMTQKDAAFFCKAFQQAVGEPSWVPADVDLDELLQVPAAGASACAVRFWATVLDIWLPRRLASVGLLWKRLGYDAVYSALEVCCKCGDPHRTLAVLHKFTRTLFDSIVRLTFEDHLCATDYAFFPGCFYDDSRTDLVVSYTTRNYGTDDLPPSQDRFRTMIIKLTVLCWVLISIRPEVGQYFMAKAALPALLDQFLDANNKDPSFALVNEIRELWADAPANGDGTSRAPREVVKEAIANHVRQDKGCTCGPECVLGWAAMERSVSIGTKRAQPLGLHKKVAAKGGGEDEMRASGISLANFCKGEQMTDLVESVWECGELVTVGILHSRTVRIGANDEHRGIYKVSDVRATMLGRLLLACVEGLRLHLGARHTVGGASTGEIIVKGDVSHQPTLAKEPAKRVHACITQPEFGASLKAKERDVVVSAVLAHADHLLPCGDRLLPRLAKAWAAHQVHQHKELELVIPILLEEMKLGYRWVPGRKEEPPCEIAKGLLGRLVVAGICNRRDHMKGTCSGELVAADGETETGFSPPSYSVYRKLASHVDAAGQFTLSYGTYLPRTPLMFASVALPATLAEGEPTESDAAESVRKQRVLSRARAELTRAQKMLAEAEEEVAMAHNNLARMKERIANLMYDPHFRVLKDVVRTSAPSEELGTRLAYHMWAASSLGGGESCGLHIDDLDLATMLNLINSLGLDAENKVVTLRGCLLMVVLCFSTSCMARARAEDFGWSSLPMAHDAKGNVMIFEPGSIDVKLPPTLTRADTAVTEAQVLTAMAEGRTVLCFFRSGGAVAGQFCHHWHLVTPMDPEDIIEGKIRVAGIAYAQRAAIVSETALQTQGSCSDATSAALAATLMREREDVQQGEEEKTPKAIQQKRRRA